MRMDLLLQPWYLHVNSFRHSPVYCPPEIQECLVLSNNTTEVAVGGGVVLSAAEHLQTSGGMTRWELSISLQPSSEMKFIE